MSDSLYEALDKIGAEDIRPTPEGYEAKCPLCDSGRRSFRAAHVGNNGRVGAFTCHKCGSNGSLVELLMRAYHMTRDRATVLAGEVSSSLRRLGRRRRKVDPNAKLGIELIAPYRPVLSEWLLERGYTEEWIWHYRVGLDLLTNELVYATYNVANDLVGITRRVADNGQPSYHLGDFVKSSHLWGIDLAMKSGESCVYVVEGQTGTLGLAPVTAPCPVVASFGSDMSEVQAKLLASHFHTIVLVYDPDFAGNKGTDRARRLLRGYGASDIFCGVIPEDVEDTGELPFAEEPEIEHMSFREWKRYTGWRSNTNAKRNNSSKKNPASGKVTARSTWKQTGATVLSKRW